LRFLIDSALSPKIATGLTQAGHSAVHVRDYRMAPADDKEILARAAAEDRVLVSSDADFGALLAQIGASQPSLVLLRNPPRRKEQQLALLLACLPTIEEPLREGSIVVVEQSRLRIRPLPIAH
jgi:predicted nuclease of predicted toxin-antitoxin system